MTTKAQRLLVRSVEVVAVGVVLLVASLVVLPACWMLYPALCNDDSNCPSGAVCVSGTCADPNAVITGGIIGDTCDGTTACPTGACVGLTCLSAEEAEAFVDDDVVVLSEDDWAALESATAVSGSIYLGTDSIIYDEDDTTLVVSGDVVLPNLRVLGGGFYFWGQRGVTSIALPALHTLDGSFEAVDMPELTRIELPELATVPGLAYTPVAGELSVDGTPKLALLSAPKLKDIGWISIDPAGSIEEPVFGAPLVVELGALRAVGNIDIWSEGNLGALTFSALEEVRGRVYVRFPDGLDALLFPSLTAIGDELNIYRATTLTSLDLSALVEVGKIDLEDNDALDTLSFPALTTVSQSLRVTGHDALTTIEMPRLTDVNNGFTVSDNPLLDVCAVQRIVDRSTPGGTVDIAGNLGDVEACP